MKKKKKLIETGIENLKIMPDPNDTILYLEGGKWYSWICIIQLTDDERDQLIETLQKLKFAKEGRKAKLREKAYKELALEPGEEGKTEEENKIEGAKILKLAQERAGISPSMNEATGEEPSV